MKLEHNNAIISKADKGNSIVILYLNDYQLKIQEFIEKNNFTILEKDPTNLFQNKIKTTIKTCPSLIPRETSTRLTHMNPTPPNIRGLPKVQETQCPIRPIVNWIGTPAYKLAKYLNQLLTTITPLPNTFNVSNTTHLMKAIQNIPHKPGIQLASLDIENMYPNIPTNEIIPIIECISCNYQHDSNTIHDLTTITNTVLEQNYFVFQNTSYSQTSGLAMGAPSAAILSEVFLQYLEHTKIVDILVQHNIIGYFRYVDDTLVIYDACMHA